MTTVSALISELSLERVDLLKIDVEGAELDVLRGIDQKDWPTIRQVSNTAPILSEVQYLTGRSSSSSCCCCAWVDHELTGCSKTAIMCSSW